MKTLKITVTVTVIFAAMLFACKKNNSKEPTSPGKLTVDAAEAFHKASETKYGNFDLVNVSGKTEKNFKSVDFSHAYIGENETSFFVEVPISYTRRQLVFRSSSSIPMDTLQKLLKNSFDRLVIYKNKVSGMVSEKIATVIPSIDYLSNGYKDLHENHFQRMVNDFSGYVTYKNWKGQFLSTLSYTFGKISNNQELSVNRLKTQSFNTDDDLCEEGTLYQWISLCEDVDEYGNGVNCDGGRTITTPVLFCSHASPTFNPGGVPMPNSSSGYWNGWPDAQNILSGCPGTPRSMESPIMWASVSTGPNILLTMYDACFCQGYSWIILEDKNTGVEYSIPISNQNFAPGDACHVEWYTNVQLPTNIPHGDYFVKVNLDSDIFYWQLQDNATGVIVKRYVLAV